MAAAGQILGASVFAARSSSAVRPPKGRLQVSGFQGRFRPGRTEGVRSWDRCGLETRRLEVPRVLDQSDRPTERQGVEEGIGG